VIPTAKGDSAAAVWSDSPQLDAGEPLKAINLTTVSLRHTSGRVENLKGNLDKDAYRVACPGTGLRTLAVVRNRFSSQKAGLLSTHLGKAYLSDPEGKVPSSQKVSAWENLGLEILPRPDKGPEVFQVIYQGKPVEKIDVEVYRPGDLDTDKVPVFRPDKEGLFAFKAPKPGRYGLLAYKEFDEKGTHDGMPFTTRRYTSTLVIEYPPPRAK